MRIFILCLLLSDFALTVFGQCVADPAPAISSSTTTTVQQSSTAATVPLTTSTTMAKSVTTTKAATTTTKVPTTTTKAPTATTKAPTTKAATTNAPTTTTKAPTTTTKAPTTTTKAPTTVTKAATTTTQAPTTAAKPVNLPGGHQVLVQNSCGKPITVYTLQDGANPIQSFTLGVNQQSSQIMPTSWAGRFWARYSDVADAVTNLPGIRPDFWLNFLFDGQPGMDNYYMSSYDGFSVPLGVAPIAGTFVTNDAIVHQCRRISCSTDFLAQCPDDLKVTVNGVVVACDSACTKYGTPEYCCNTADTTSQATCKQNQYGVIFKAACQDVFSYPFDSLSSSFFCTAAPNVTSGYAVTFCPAGQSSDSRTPAVPRPIPGPNDPGHVVSFKNSCNRNITLFTRENGGWPLTTVPLPLGASTSQKKPLAWGGRFWARYDEYVPLLADFDGVRVQPDSLFEVLFDGWQGLDFYDISLVDGFSVPLSASVTAGTYTKNPVDYYSCGNISCLTDFVAHCPAGLELYEGSDLVACQSACTAFGTPEYCCAAPQNTPATCPPSTYSLTFKNACKDAYSYAYDDTTSTFTCKSADPANNVYSGYNVNFCA